MSNPGVIKLAREWIGRHLVWLDDNIGESIHFHIDEWRIDFTIKDFMRFCDELEGMVYELIGQPEIRHENWDIRFIHQISPCLKNLKEIRNETIQLGSITLSDDSGMLVELKDGALVRALEGKIDLNETEFRKSNYYGETNETRMVNCMEFVKKHGYPYKDGYIAVAEENNQILDGWHRASCLYYLYGDIEIEVKKFIFDDDIIPFDAFLFPAYRVKQNSRIVLYGAGYAGHKYYDQINESGYCVIAAWVDQNFRAINREEEVQITDPMEINKVDYDYVVVANANIQTKEEIQRWLIDMGVSKEKIIA